MDRTPFLIVMKKFLKSLNIFEWSVWIVGVISIVLSFFLLKNTQYHYLVGALIGVTCLIFESKGNPIGQFLTIVFAVFYGIISFSFKYYGEMITYLGMTTPIAVYALVVWLKNPYNGNKSEVRVNEISGREWIIFMAANVAVTVAFYFILRALNTANLIVSTVSVFTSFLAVYLTARRSRFYAVGYAMNDVVLITMWVFASVDDLTYLPMVICFTVFLIVDVYAFFNWTRMLKRQQRGDLKTEEEQK